MNRRIWTGILAGVLAATVILGVAGAAYRVGQTQELVTGTVGDDRKLVDAVNAHRPVLDIVANPVPVERETKVA